MDWWWWIIWGYTWQDSLVLERVYLVFELQILKLDSSDLSNSTSLSINQPPPVKRSITDPYYPVLWFSIQYTVLAPASGQNNSSLILSRSVNLTVHLNHLLLQITHHIDFWLIDWSFTLFCFKKERKILFDEQNINLNSGKFSNLHYWL